MGHSTSSVLSDQELPPQTFSGTARTGEDNSLGQIRLCSHYFKKKKKKVWYSDQKEAQTKWAELNLENKVKASAVLPGSP